MKGVMMFAVGISVAAVYFAAGSSAAPPTADVLVAAPPAQVRAQLAPLFDAVERKATSMTTVTGRPPIKVAYRFEHGGDTMGFEAKAGFRTVILKVRTAAGAQPGTTQLSVYAEPSSLITSARKPDPLSAVSDVLTRAEPQFAEGARVNALFDSGWYDPTRPDRPYGALLR